MSNNSGKFLLGAFLGAIAGATLGVLFAPRSGKETRKIIKEKSKEYVDKGKEMWKKEGKVVKEVVKKAADNVSKKMS